VNPELESAVTVPPMRLATLPASMVAPIPAGAGGSASSTRRIRSVSPRAKPRDLSGSVHFAPADESVRRFLRIG
jgi:hypothetical protein